MPALPRTIADVDLDGDWGCTLAGAPFVFHQDAEMIILGTERNLQISGRWIFVIGCRRTHFL